MLAWIYLPKLPCCREMYDDIANKSMSWLTIHLNHIHASLCFLAAFSPLKPRLDEIIIVSSAIVQKIEFYKLNRLPDERIPGYIF